MGKLLTKLNQWQMTIYENKWWSITLVFLLSFLISIPVFVFFRKNVFDLNWEIPIDKITLFFGILFAFWFIIYNLKKYLIYSFTIYFIVFIIASLEGNYSFFKVIDSYRIIVYNADDNYEREAIKPNTLLPFPNKNSMIITITRKIG
jgi:hypothetical protein